jgi:hypothetical protein
MLVKKELIFVSGCILLQTDSTGKDDENEMVVSRKWDELPVEMVELLLTRLSLVDCLRLPSVCKAWSQASSSLEKRNDWPWLMHLPNLKYRQCKFFDPFYCKEYTIKCDELAASDHLALRFSKNGWVVVTEGNQRVFLLNPFTAQIFNLPALTSLDFILPTLEDYIFDGISFTSVPTSPDFIVYGFFFQVCGKFVSISMWRPGEEEWTTIEFVPYVPFLPSFNNPVLFRGEFYCLGRKGELGVFNPELETWTVLSNPEPVYLVEPHYGDEYCYLMELNGDLISVFGTDDTQKAIRAFKLDQSKMVWRKLEDLGDMTLFVDRRNSIAIRSPEKKYANRIYITRWEGVDSKKGIFYSMEDHKYYPSVHSMEEPVTCVWMEPNLYHS